MPLLVASRGRVIHVKEERPKIGSRSGENLTTQQYKRLHYLGTLSDSMSFIQQALLKRGN
jgi:hypothetical protein